jgi:hypothetical protein
MTRVELRSRFSAETCSERLLRNAQRDSLRSWFGTRRAFLIRAHGNRFRLRLRTATFRSAFSPILYGLIEPVGAGALITGSFRMHPLVRAFAWLWFSLVTAIGGTLFIISARAVLQRSASGFDGPVWVGFIAGPGVLLLGFWLLRFGWSSQVRDIKAFLAVTVASRATERPNRRLQPTAADAIMSRRG